MTLLITGLLLFTCMHLVPALPAIRSLFVSTLGEKPYLAIYSLTSFAGIFLIIWGKKKAAFSLIWETPAWGKYAAMLLMLVSLTLFAAANMRSNVKRFTRHPMLWGLLVWASAHLLTNGDLASMILFGGFAIYAIISMGLLTLKGGNLQTDKYPLSKDLIVLSAGLVAFVILVILHPFLFKVAII